MFPEFPNLALILKLCVFWKWRARALDGVCTNNFFFFYKWYRTSTGKSNSWNTQQMVKSKKSTKSLHPSIYTIYHCICSSHDTLIVKSGGKCNAKTQNTKTFFWNLAEYYCAKINLILRLKRQLAEWDKTLDTLIFPEIFIDGMAGKTCISKISMM